VWEVWAAVIGAVGRVVAAVIKAIFGEPLRGQIVSPKSGEQVPRSFLVDGTLSRKIPRGRHVWLAVQLGNLLFPKEPELPRRDLHWAQEIVEGGDPPGASFSVALLMVDRNGHRAIEEWLARGREGEGFPGMEEIPGSEKLSVVRQLTLGDA
jgi:hypothetical protein